MNSVTLRGVLPIEDLFLLADAKQIALVITKSQGGFIVWFDDIPFFPNFRIILESNPNKRLLEDKLTNARIQEPVSVIENDIIQRLRNFWNMTQNNAMVWEDLGGFWELTELGIDALIGEIFNLQEVEMLQKPIRRRKRLQRRKN